MLRGKRLFEALTLDDRLEQKNKTDRKGRSEEKIKDRNTCICYRYFYHSKIKKNRYENVLELLANEFFLSERTVTTIISNESPQLKNVFNEKLTITNLKEKYDYYKW